MQWCDSTCRHVRSTALAAVIVVTQWRQARIVPRAACHTPCLPAQRVRHLEGEVGWSSTEDRPSRCVIARSAQLCLTVMCTIFPPNPSTMTHDRAGSDPKVTGKCGETSRSGSKQHGPSSCLRFAGWIYHAAAAASATTVSTPHGTLAAHLNVHGGIVRKLSRHPGSGC